jgi:hypothetical protein
MQWACAARTCCDVGFAHRADHVWDGPTMLFRKCFERHKMITADNNAIEIRNIDVLTLKCV